MNRLGKKTALYFLLVILSIIFFYPFIILLANSLRPINTSIVPFFQDFEINNYKYAVTLIPYLKYLRSSLIIVFISLSFGVIMNLIFGYAFARLHAPGKAFWFAVVLAQLMIPDMAVTIPQYVLFTKLGLKDTYWIWVLNGIGGTAFFIFLFRQYLSTLPRDLEDAARIDGCSVIQTILRIFVPLSKPVIAVVAFFCFQSNWGDYMTPFMYLNPDKYTLSLSLFNCGVGYELQGHPEFILKQVQLAAAVLFIIPVVILFFFAQRNLVEGIVTTGIKG